jgi:hypothetical protein
MPAGGQKRLLLPVASVQHLRAASERVLRVAVYGGAARLLPSVRPPCLLCSLVFLSLPLASAPALL